MINIQLDDKLKITSDKDCYMLWENEDSGWKVFGYYGDLKSLLIDAVDLGVKFLSPKTLDELKSAYEAITKSYKKMII